MDIEVTSVVPEHEDDRGAMFKPIDGDEIRAVFHVTSEPDTVRANHYHKTQSQWLYLTDGSIELSIQDRRKDSDGDIETKRMQPGDLIKFPPQVAHALVIHEYTEFFEFMDHAQGPDGEFYDEDTVEVELVSE